jgi:hypothetical protein
MDHSQIERVQPEHGAPDIADPLKVVARDLGVSLPTLYREIALGRIRLSKIAGRSVIFRSDRQAYVDLLKAEADARQAERQKQPA